MGDEELVKAVQERMIENEVVELVKVGELRAFHELSLSLFLSQNALPARVSSHRQFHELSSSYFCPLELGSFAIIVKIKIPDHMIIIYFFLNSRVMFCILL